MNTIIKSFLVIVIIVIVAFLVYAFSPLLYDKEVNEEFPIPITQLDTSSEVEIVEAEVEINLSEEDASAQEKEMELSESQQELMTLYEGSFQGADSFHKVSGSAFIIDVGDSLFLRLEDFSSTNGPDLKVYFATDGTASDFISLGELKGNKGDQNYELTDQIDFEKYDTVLIWCERFSTLFGTADLTLS